MEIPMEPKTLGLLVAVLFFLISLLINLLQRRSGGVDRASRLERRPELRPNHARAQARDVCVGVGVHAAQLVGGHIAARGLVDPDDPRQVVVSVEQRRA